MVFHKFGYFCGLDKSFKKSSIICISGNILHLRKIYLVFLIPRAFRLAHVIGFALIFGFEILQFQVKIRKIVKRIHYPLRI